LGFSTALTLDEKTGDQDCFNPQDVDDASGTGAKKKSRESQMPMNPSIKLLKQMGLPNQLCDLVYNMLDCVNGD
jgi:hypothetical protein